MPSIKREFYGVCPTCWSTRVKTRVFKSPRYKCEKCGFEFPNKKKLSYEHRKFFNRILKSANIKRLCYPNMTDIEARKLAVISMKVILSPK